MPPLPISKDAKLDLNTRKPGEFEFAPVGKVGSERCLRLSDQFRVIGLFHNIIFSNRSIRFSRMRNLSFISDMDPDKSFTKFSNSLAFIDSGRLSLAFQGLCKVLVT